jgi:hypothetical protein
MYDLGVLARYNSHLIFENINLATMEDRPFVRFLIYTEKKTNIKKIARHLCPK